MLRSVPVRFVLVVISACLVGGLAGLIEGAIYPPGGPRIHLAMYWTLLAVALFNSLYAFAQLLEPRGARALAHAVATLPMCVVAQDAGSLLLQGSSPATANWYASIFGEHLLTRDLGPVPGFYVVFTLGSLAMLMVTFGALADEPRPHPTARSRRRMSSGRRRIQAHAPTAPAPSADHGEETASTQASGR